MATLLVNNGTHSIPDSTSSGDALWLETAGLEEATGWTLKPEGVCRDEVCVPLPRGREHEFVDGARFNFAGFARYLGQPVLHHAPSENWVVGEAADTRAIALRSLQVPDFTLPDMAGVQHTLSSYRGRKVFLVSWASW